MQTDIIRTRCVLNNIHYFNILVILRSMGDHIHDSGTDIKHETSLQLWFDVGTPS